MTGFSTLILIFFVLLFANGLVLGNDPAVHLARINMFLPAYALFIVMLPQIILGILVPIIARICVGSELWHP